ncbi:MAG: cytochrome P450 [Acidimicrobiales bacterium]
MDPVNPTPASSTDACEMARTFDYWSPTYAPDPYALFRRLRRDCPVAHSDELDGFYILSRYEHVGSALRDHGNFTSTILTAPAIPVEVRAPVPPLDQDPPAHARYRQLLLPFFTPSRAAGLEATARDTARRLAAACTGTIEAYMSYCFPMPTIVLSQILGIDASDYEQFANWIALTVDGQGVDPGAAVEASDEIREYLTALLARRKQEPRDDILTFLLTAEVEGEPLTDAERLGIAQVLLIAGIDTTANTLGHALLYLAEHPEERARLIRDRSLIHKAIEEFLRVYAPVSLVRGARADTEVGGCPIPAGVPVFLSIPSANRDERQFSDAEQVVLDRNNNAHLAFGAGVHRCIGAHVARMELRVGLEEFLAAVPDFRLADPDGVSWKPGPIRGPNRFELVCG